VWTTVFGNGPLFKTILPLQKPPLIADQLAAEAVERGGLEKASALSPPQPINMTNETGGYFLAPALLWVNVACREPSFTSVWSLFFFLRLVRTVQYLFRLLCSNKLGVLPLNFHVKQLFQPEEQVAPDSLGRHRSHSGKIPFHIASFRHKWFCFFRHQHKTIYHGKNIRENLSLTAPLQKI